MPKKTYASGCSAERNYVDRVDGPKRTYQKEVEDEKVVQKEAEQSSEEEEEIEETLPLRKPRKELTDEEYEQKEKELEAALRRQSRQSHVDLTKKRSVGRPKKEFVELELTEEEAKKYMSISKHKAKQLEKERNPPKPRSEAQMAAFQKMLEKNKEKFKQRAIEKEMEKQKALEELEARMKQKLEEKVKVKIPIRSKEKGTFSDDESSAIDSDAPPEKKVEKIIRKASRVAKKIEEINAKKEREENSKLLENVRVPPPSTAKPSLTRGGFATKEQLLAAFSK